MAAPVLTRRARNHATVVPSDTTVFPHPSVIYVGGVGNVNCVDVFGHTVLYAAGVQGTVLPCEVVQVLATDTTATLMVRCWD